MADLNYIIIIEAIDINLVIEFCEISNLDDDDSRVSSQ